MSKNLKQAMNYFSEAPCCDMKLIAGSYPSLLNIRILCPKHLKQPNLQMPSKS